MRYLSLFTGVGGFDLGLDNSGMRCVMQVERDRQSLSVLERHWPNVDRLNDVNRLLAILEPRNACREGASARPVQPDLICGGFPCQDVSVAGRRAGLAGGRSGLWFTFRRIIGLVRPRWVLIENVPGLLSSNGGRDMGAVLGGLAGMGYGWAYRCLDSQWFGLAQRRKRVFIVGCSRGTRLAAEVLFERDRLPWDSAPSRTERETPARTLRASHSRRSEFDPDYGLAIYSDKGSSSWTENQPTLAASDDNGSNHVVFNPRQITSKTNRSNPQPGDPCHTLCDDAPMLAHTLRAEGHDASEDGTGIGVPLVASTLGTNCGDATNNDGKRGSPKNLVQAFQTRIARNGRGQPKEITDALTSSEAGSHGDSKPHVTVASGVRRLTPRECERLQGFPDDWTRWAADGSELSDSARYRMLGNAVSVPVAEWIGRRIMAVN